MSGPTPICLAGKCSLTIPIKIGVLEAESKVVVLKHSWKLAGAARLQVAWGCRAFLQLLRLLRLLGGEFLLARGKH